MNATLVFTVLGGLVLLLGSIALRSNSKNKLEVKNVDIVLLLLPVVVWLMATGKISKLAVPGLEVETAQAIVNAATAPIETQVTGVDETGVSEAVEIVDRARKGGVGEIPALARRGTPALSFQLGRGNYDGGAIREYLTVLVERGNLKYLVVNDTDGTFFGFYDAAAIQTFLVAGGRDQPSSYDIMAQNLNHSDARARQWLSGLPGFVGADLAVTREMSKSDALERMQEHNTDILPVVDAGHRFVGVVNRSRLTAGLILEVSKALEAKKQG